MDELISVIVPVYNVESYLNKCIQSIVNQTYNNLEIILIDDGSTDQSGRLCDNWKKKDDRITVIHKSNGGLSSARNAGIDMATGKYIGFIDSDDAIHKKMFEVLAGIMCQRQADIVICNRYYTYEDGKQYLKYSRSCPDLVMDSERAILEMNCFRNFDMAAWGKLYKKSLFQTIRFPDGKLSEDYFVMYKLFDIADKIVYHSEPLYYYTQRKGSISKGKKINLDFVEAAHQQMIYVEKKYPRLRDNVHAAYASANMTVYNIVIGNQSNCSVAEKEKIRKAVKDNMKHINGNSYWSLEKKMQSYLFVWCLPLYNMTFLMLKRIRKV